MSFHFIHRWEKYSLEGKDGSEQLWRQCRVCHVTQFLAVISPSLELHSSARTSHPYPLTDPEKVVRLY